MAGHQLVLVLDFGSQFTQLIARRVREQRVFCEVHAGDLSIDEIRRRNPIGVILSGGPQSVYDREAIRPAAGIFELGVPVLGICYGMNLIAHLLGGQVESAERREYGRAEVEIADPGTVFVGLGARESVWMSHGDQVTRAPEGFLVSARTANARIAGFEEPSRRVFGVQFHPEVSHTHRGAEMLHNFLFRACGARGEPASCTDSGPPDRITALGFISRNAASAFWNGTISE